ncbi:MAG: hypothetical protein N2254_05265 [bacterium]|nr:hypothetical protein [bacterium]
MISLLIFVFLFKDKSIAVFSESFDVSVVLFKKEFAFLESIEFKVFQKSIILFVCA